ncbi:hypothetical protein OC846_002503 [Tilletia horrida]|uniref:Uncharacterized protein n=1 Tax=Tilletia horrida TaxID=155126 RepID=A0AAN6GU89_9BASI|nr:hypothetical protein OC845_003375 [Tilletia horrida]KAK0553454.1 hypothetical protein OC846_002503 [Tilletia horrida]KAK0568013.1 hypothetical protein OC861_002395 [Tilletia horrida]
MKFATLAVLSLAAVVVSAPIEKREPSVSCGGKRYSSGQVATAVDYSDSNAAPSTTYPHQYNNYEGFNFRAYCSDSTYDEYPLTTSGYTGGSPGPDRVIVGRSSGTFCGAITHTGASGSSFLKCSY